MWEWGCICLHMGVCTCKFGVCVSVSTCETVYLCESSMMTRWLDRLWGPVFCSGQQDRGLSIKIKGRKAIHSSVHLQRAFLFFFSFWQIFLIYLISLKYQIKVNKIFFFNERGISLKKEWKNSPISPPTEISSDLKNNIYILYTYIHMFMYTHTHVAQGTISNILE